MAARPPRVLAWPAFANRRPNPYNALLYDGPRALGVLVDDFYPRRLLFGRYDIRHPHWPESIPSLPRPWQALPLAILLRFLLRAARARGIEIVWTARTLRSHEGRRPRAEAQLWRALHGQPDGLIAPTGAGERQAPRRFPALRNRPGFAIPHGPDRASYPDAISRAEARERLGLPGDARDCLARPGPAVQEPAPPDPHVPASGGVGRASGHRGQGGCPGPRARAARGGRGDARVRLDLAFVPPDLVPAYLRAADLVALPYKDILNSGSAVLALSFERPVLVPARGALRELAGGMGGEWVRTCAGELRPRDLAAALRWAVEVPRDAARLFHDLSWDEIARQTLVAYRAIGQ